jgi:hypothetical protein
MAVGNYGCLRYLTTPLLGEITHPSTELLGERRLFNDIKKYLYPKDYYVHLELTGMQSSAYPLEKAEQVVQLIN